MNLSTNTNYTLPSELQSRFQVLSEIARTRTSVVYLAKESLLDRKIALKISACPTEEQAERFRKEAQTLATLKHPNIVQLFSFGSQEIENGQLTFLAMEYLEGKTLEKMLRADSLNTVQFQEIFLPILDALSFAHSVNIIHRDLKPANIMILECPDSSPLVKLLDFGISKQTVETRQTTVTLELSGTPKYMSPEQCKGKPCTAVSDIYSLACVMYEAIAGSAPFAGDTAAVVMYKQINEAAAIPTGINADQKISRELVKAIMKGLEKDPEKRPQSMEQYKSLILSGLNSQNYNLRQPKNVLKIIVLTLLCFAPLSLVMPHSSHKSIKRAPVKVVETEIEKDKEKGLDTIKAECRLLRAEGKYDKSAERLEAVLNDPRRRLNGSLKFCYLDETAKSYYDMKKYDQAEKYWRLALKKVPWDEQEQYPIVMDRLCQVLVATGRLKEAESWCNQEIAKLDPSAEISIANFQSIKARALMSAPGRKREALKLLKKSLAVYDKTEDGRSSKIAMGAGKDIYVLARELGELALAEKELTRTRDAILNFEAPEGGAVWNALNLSFFMEDKNRIEDAILLKERSIELSKKTGNGSKENPMWEAAISALKKKLHN